MFGFLKKKLTEFKSKIVKGKEEEKSVPTANASTSTKNDEQNDKSMSSGVSVTLEGTSGREISPTNQANQTHNKVSTKQKSGSGSTAGRHKTRGRSIPIASTPRVPRKHETTSKKAPPSADNTGSSKGKMPKGTGVLSKIKRAVSGKVVLSEEELDSYLWELELILLESDVAYEVVDEMIHDLKTNLLGKEFASKSDVFNQIVANMKTYLLSKIPKPVDILTNKHKPTVIMFIGPNGAGKTTTMAKLANIVLKSGKTVIFSASDTFRAASIEQLEEHARNLGVRVVKHQYGADPAAVAFDAVQSAKARNIDFVFIDTAGRQETNKNLLDELKKIKRVANPDFIVYVDEGVAGNVILDRLKSFGDLEITGIILTKMDLDAKGGGVITAASMSIPILYFGTGQNYDDLQPFDPNKFVDELLGVA